MVWRWAGRGSHLGEGGLAALPCQTTGRENVCVRWDSESRVVCGGGARAGAEWRNSQRRRLRRETSAGRTHCQTSEQVGNLERRKSGGVLTGGGFCGLAVVHVWLGPLGAADDGPQHW